MAMLCYSALLVYSMLILILYIACSGREPANPVLFPLKDVRSIPVPDGFARVDRDAGSFADWLGNRSLKKDNRVRLYDGTLKRDQTGHYAVLDMSVGNKDLQQCADAIMRLRAEYLFDKAAYDSIQFLSTSMQKLKYTDWCRGTRYRLKANSLQAYETDSRSSYTRESLLEWLEFVFVYAGTYSLQKQLRPLRLETTIMPGDVIVEGGFPGHAMIVMDAVSNADGEQQILLGQSYMPAQEMHIVRNPRLAEIAAWFQPQQGKALETPDWRFKSLQFYRW